MGQRSFTQVVAWWFSKYSSQIQLRCLQLFLSCHWFQWPQPSFLVWLQHFLRQAVQRHHCHLQQERLQAERRRCRARETRDLVERHLRREQEEWQGDLGAPQREG